VGFAVDEVALKRDSMRVLRSDILAAFHQCCVQTPTLHNLTVV